MTFNGWLQIAVFSVVIVLLVKPFGGYMTRVFNGEHHWLSPVLGPVERGLYRLSGVDEKKDQHWVTYTVSMLLFSLAGFLSLYALQRLQAVLPLNPAGQSAVEPGLAFNTAMSFDTNTNWQSYVPETTMSYLVQMAGLTVHNFVSAATGIALAVALIRGFARRSTRGIGNFWVDLTRCTLYVLLPISVVVGVFFVWQGMPQNLAAYTEATTIEGAKQVIAQGPVASQEVIKMLGTNGGGFFNANSSHPFENPNAITNFVQLVLIFSIGAGLTNVFGRMVGDERQGWAVLAVMGVLFLTGVTAAYWAESAGNPAFAALGVDSAPSALQAGGNMEGKEVRFGIANSALFATVTTDASCGAVNSMHDSFTPLGGLVPLFNIQLGEIIFGGVGSGLYGMLLFAILAVFIAGLMVGRTPEYLGKKIEAKEVKMAMLAILILPLSILGFSALATVLPAGLAGPANQGPHGFSEILYAYTSGTGNNGSAFAGISANTLFFNTTIAFAMFMGRFLMIVPTMAIAGGARRQEDHSGVRRHVSDPQRPVRRPGRRRDRDRRRAHLFSGARFGPRRRAPLDGGRNTLLIQGEIPMELSHERKRLPVTTMTDPKIMGPAVIDAFKKLHPRAMVRNPVMFAVEAVATLTTLLLVRDLVTGGGGLGFAFQINLWLWFTVLFANFAEAVAEGRGKAQAATLRKAKSESVAKRLVNANAKDWKSVPGSELRQGDLVLVEAGDLIPSDGEGDRGHRLGQRGRDHGRIGAGHPRKRRRPEQR